MNRWRRAQKKEKEFAMSLGSWQTPKFSELDKGKRQNHLQGLLNVTRSSVDNLKSKTLLEIGGVYFAGIAAETIPGIEAIALDPLINIFQNRSDKCRYIYGTAENMNLNDNSIDICICRNAIDHMESPEKALQEIKRVLKIDGKLYISCNVFSELSRPLFPLFDFLDSPHPHHYSASSFLNLLTSNKYQIEFTFPADKTNFRNIKVFIGRKFGLRHLALYCSINGK